MYLLELKIDPVSRTSTSCCVRDKSAMRLWPLSSPKHASSLIEGREVEGREMREIEDKVEERGEE